jgi:hypothetical protein
VAGFLIGVLSSLTAGAVLFVLLTNRDDVAYFIKDRNLHKHLSDGWIQYHLSGDARVSSTSPIWVEHKEILKVSRFGRVRGTSKGCHPPTPLDYVIKGKIRRGIARLDFHNVTSDENDVVIIYPNLLSNSVVIGMWVGHDFNKRPSVGPILLSKTELTEDERNGYVHAECQILTVKRSRSKKQVIDLNNPLKPATRPTAPKPPR